MSQGKLRSIAGGSASTQDRSLSGLSKATVDFIRVYAGTTSTAERERARVDLWYVWHSHRCFCSSWSCAGALLASVPPIVFDCGGRATLPAREAHYVEVFDSVLASAKSLLWQDWEKDVLHVGMRFHEGVHTLYLTITGLQGDA